MSDNNFSNTIDTLFKGMESFISSKTVVGEAIKVDGETTILPLIDVSFGVGAGAFAKESKKSNSGGGGLGGKISPNAVIVIRNGEARIINIKNQDLVTKAFEVVPELINKVKNKNQKDDVDMEVEEIVNDIKDNYDE
ncbi:MAG: sporulation protein [Lachnospiraceae bacterium]|nr:sporulation protein [Lachnospiraceae bacterium]